MSFILTTAFDTETCQRMDRVLGAMGLQSPEVPSSTIVSPADLCRKMTARRGSAKKYAQISSKKIGRAWELQASEIIIQNSEQSPWHWSSPDALPLLEFWRDFEPQARIILVYGSPKSALAALQKDATMREDGASETLLSDHMQRWQEYHASLLRFYTENQEDCLLVSAEQLVNTPSELVDLIETKFGLSARQPVQIEFDEPSVPPMLDVIAAGLLAENHDIASLFSELENSADFPGRRGRNAPIDAEGAWIEFVNFQDGIGKLTEENEFLLLQLQQVQEELESLFVKTKDQEEASNQELAKLQASLNKAEKSVADLQSKFDEERRSNEDASRLEDENELLLLQLQQVQEELEHLFVQTQKNDRKEQPGQSVEPPATPTDAGVKTVSIDLRHFIDGQNWHEAEHDGRWTGPGTRSTLRLPGVYAGRYAIHLEIVSGMARHILDGVTLRLGGNDVSSTIAYRTELNGPLAAYKRARVRRNTKLFPYPARLTGILQVGADQAGKPISLEIGLPETIAPITRGENDTRALGLRISTVTVQPA